MTGRGSRAVREHRCRAFHIRRERGGWEHITRRPSHTQCRQVAVEFFGEERVRGVDPVHIQSSERPYIVVHLAPMLSCAPPSLKARRDAMDEQQREVQRDQQKRLNVILRHEYKTPRPLSLVQLIVCCAEDTDERHPDQHRYDVENYDRQ